MIPITPAQLKNILQSNVLTLCPLSESNFKDSEMQIEMGAHVLLAPACDACDEKEQVLFEQIFQAAGEKAFVAGRIVPPHEGLFESGGRAG